MSLPGNTLSTPAVPANLLMPDSVLQVNRTIDYERGGLAIGDSSQGIDYQTWRISLNGIDVQISPEHHDSEIVLFTALNVSEVALAFDQNMQPAVAYIANNQAKLYWYDSLVAAQVTTDLDSAITSVALTMDDKRAFATDINTNDILLVYIKDNQVFYRQQRERYTIERFLASIDLGGTQIVRCGMNVAGRLQIEVL